MSGSGPTEEWESMVTYNSDCNGNTASVPTASETLYRGYSDPDVEGRPVELGWVCG